MNVDDLVESLFVSEQNKLIKHFLRTGQHCQVKKIRNHYLIYGKRTKKTDGQYGGRIESSK